MPKNELMEDTTLYHKTELRLLAAKTKRETEKGKELSLLQKN